ncbi:MAG TPA: alpha/beta hydrolase [Thermomicrobiaceae bacterium]|nr:alpha/beta hydrolase [Thermomicrobiaceae bacterium]
MLIHGIWDRWEAWQPVIPELSTRYHLVIPELRGHGRSDKPAGGYELTDYAGDIRNLIERLELPQPFICGHSLGALVTMQLAADDRFGRISAVILEDPPLRITSDGAASFNILLHVKHGSEEETYAAVSEIYAGRGETEWQRITEWLRGTADGPLEQIVAAGGRNTSFLPLIGEVQVPMLLLQADPAFGGAMSDEDAESARQLKADTAFQRFDATGHGIHQQRPADFCRAVFTFLEELHQNG